MFLEEISELQTIVEASDYGRKVYFDYQKTVKGHHVLSTPNPVVLYLGTWRMTDKAGIKKKFLCGLNLAYLDEDDLAGIQHSLPDILKSKHMKTRYRIGKTLLPDIFKKAYRTYNINNIVARPIRGRLYALKPTDHDKEEAKGLASKDGQEWGELDNKIRNQYLDQAVRKRGSDDVERQDRSKEERIKLDKHIQDRRKEPPKQAELPKSFKSAELGPGFEPEDVTPKLDPAVPSTKNVKTGMVNPHKLIIKKPKSDDLNVIGDEPDAPKYS